MSEIVELRQYTLKPGQRDVLIALFEREFIESQEVLGMEVIGTFRDADHPDRFVWLRGFPNMESRAKALTSFYGGPVWQAHRQAANATMLDSDNVLLLRPAWSGSGFASGHANTQPGPAVTPAGGVVAAIWYFGAPATETLVETFRSGLRSMFGTKSGMRFVAAFVTERSANTFPALPVREGENAFVWFARASDLEAVRSTEFLDALKRLMAHSPEVLRLMPTSRSRLGN